MIKLRQMWFYARLLYRMSICYCWNLIRYRSADKAREANKKWLKSVNDKLDVEIEKLKNMVTIKQIENMLLTDRKKKLEKEVAALKAIAATLEFMNLFGKEEK